MSWVQLIASVSLITYFASLPKFLTALWVKSGFEPALFNLGISALLTGGIYFCLFKIESYKNQQPGS